MAANNMEEVASDVLELPGFRFHPTEEELLDFYLKNMISGKMRFDIIGYLNIYHYDPCDLPGIYLHTHIHMLHIYLIPLYYVMSYKLVIFLVRYTKKI